MNEYNQPYIKQNRSRTDMLVGLLRRWYEKNQRDLVWRQTREPYAIWISEIMAQQTRITAVLPYYKRFMKRFPALKDLSDAPVDDVLKAWEGLGYYSRAHNLSKTARILMTEWEGKFPVDSHQLKKLPGIGDYTAGAIASICFDEPVPAVDGNVLRVFSRIENNEMDIHLPDTKKQLTAYLKDIMPARGAGIFNQSLMELGALVCLPKKPLCEECPVSTLCEAYHLDKQDLLPVKSQKKEPKQVKITILLITNPHGEILLRQRNENLLKGLWEFYCLNQVLSTKEVYEHLQELGYTPAGVTAIGEANHIFTHMKWHMHGYHCIVEEVQSPDGFAFVGVGDMEKLAMPTAIQYFRDWALTLSSRIKNNPFIFYLI